MKTTRRPRASIDLPKPSFPLGRGLFVVCKWPMSRSGALPRRLNQDEQQIFNDISRILNLQPNIFEMRLLVLSLISLLTANAFGQSYTLTVESSEPVAAEGPCTDSMSTHWIHGQNLGGLRQRPDAVERGGARGIFNNPMNTGWNATGVNPALLGAFPELADDSYATLGLDGPAALVPGAVDPAVVQDAQLAPSITEFFTTGGTSLSVNTVVGGSWYVLNTASNALHEVKSHDASLIVASGL